MLLTTRMKLVLAGEPETPLPGVKVALYDRDEADPDDHLDTGVTDAQGEVLFKFDSERYTDAEDSPEAITRFEHPLYRINQRLGGVGYNVHVLGGL